MEATIKANISKDINNRFAVHVVSNPEFLREGSAVKDFEHPDKIVVGINKAADSKYPIELMRNLYGAIKLRNDLYIEVSNETAELCKYACNAFLAMKVSYINEIAQLCNVVGANVQDVAKSMGADGRISGKFLNPGPGYGGSCFPKDVKALEHIAKEHSQDLALISSLSTSNKDHIKRSARKIIDTFGDVGGKQIAVLGLSFKPKTDDVRDSPAISIIKTLLEYGANVRATCPKGIPEMKKQIEGNKYHIRYFDDVYETVMVGDAIFFVTYGKL